MALSLSKYKVAVVDVPEILSHSDEIQTLKREQDKVLDELDTLISKAQNDLLNEKELRFADELFFAEGEFFAIHDGKIAEDLENLLYYCPKCGSKNLTGAIITETADEQDPNILCLDCGYWRD